MAELRGLGDVHTRLQAADGTVLAISADTIEDSKRVSTHYEIPFDLLCDPSLTAVRELGLLHHEALRNKDISRPAMFLIDKDGTIVWRFVAHRVQDRAFPEDIRKALDTLLGPEANG